jgi:uncharacterized repeat protein (TIGR01451 family)
MGKDVDKSGQLDGSKLEMAGRCGDLFKRRFYMIFMIALFSVLILLFFAAIATPASAGVDYEYNAWDKVSNSWVTGNIKGYNEGECIPSYLNVTNDGVSTEVLNLILYFDYQDVSSGRLGIIRYECCADCSQCPATPPDCCIGGADLSTCAAAGTITGPVFYENQGGVDRYAYYWNFTISAGTTSTQCWCARLSNESALFSQGASLQMKVKPAPGTGTCSIPTSAIGTPDLYATKTANVICDEINYTINYGNSGEVNQTGTTLVDDYDETKVTVKDAGGGTDDGNNITWSIGTVAVGASGSKNYTVSINQGVANGAVIINSGNISGDLAERVITNNTYSVTSYAKVSPVANFTSDSPKPFCTNISFTNTTTGGATPYTSWYWDFDDDENTSNDQNPSYHFSAPGTYNVTLTVTDSNGCTNSTTKQVEVTIAPSISVTKTASPSSGAASTNVNFTIVVTNTGDCILDPVKVVDTDPVKVVDTLPTGMTYVSSSPAANTTGGTTIWDNVGPLAAFTGSKTLYLVAHIDSDATGILNNTVNGTGTPPAGDNVSDEAYAEVTTLVPAITVTKTASPSSGAASTNVNFTIVVTNTGDCILDPVKVVDTLCLILSCCGHDRSNDDME